MSLLHAILLGIIQGLTEFLPVSSSGHLVLSQRLLGFQGPGILFDTFFHLGTLISVCLCFRGDIVAMGRALIRRDYRSPWARLFLMICIGTIPTAIIGFVFQDFFEGLFARVMPTAAMLLVTGSLLFAADRMKTAKAPARTVSTGTALVIGLVQGAAIVPGLSRSGSTISTGILIGLERNLAARYSFLLSIPSVAGAGLLQVPGVVRLEGHLLLPLILGTAVSCATGYLAIRLLLGFVSRRRLSFFSYYCWALGAAVLLVSVIRIFGY